MYTASNDPAATADPTATNNEENRDLNPNETVLQILESCATTFIRDNVPGLINGNPSRDVLNRLSAMVREGLHSGVSMEILNHDCGPKGRALAKKLAKKLIKDG